VLIGDKVPIHGAEFEFDYSFHTVPTVRFKLSFLDKSISYSSDTYYNPQVLRHATLPCVCDTLGA
jgi:hypothetical protein